MIANDLKLLLSKHNLLYIQPDLNTYAKRKPYYTVNI